jgi:hypothetical protein
VKIFPFITMLRGFSRTPLPPNTTTANLQRVDREKIVKYQWNYLVTNKYCTADTMITNFGSRLGFLYHVATACVLDV